MKKNISSAKNSKELYEIVKRHLNTAKKRGDYIVDRNKCRNFGLIFKDGVCSYSAIDLFCERIFKKSGVKVLTKSVDTLSAENQAIVDEYLKANQYLANLPKDVSEIDADETKRCAETVENLSTKIGEMETIKKDIDIPFYVNPLTKDEFPLICLKDASDEELNLWAQKLVAFIEINKEMLTPAAFSPHSQPDGLQVMKVHTPFWTDIVVR